MAGRGWFESPARGWRRYLRFGQGIRGQCHFESPTVSICETVAWPVKLRRWPTPAAFFFCMRGMCEIPPASVGPGPRGHQLHQARFWSGRARARFFLFFFFSFLLLNTYIYIYIYIYIFCAGRFKVGSLPVVRGSRSRTMVFFVHGGRVGVFRVMFCDTPFWGQKSGHAHVAMYSKGCVVGACFCLFTTSFGWIPLSKTYLLKNTTFQLFG